MHAYETYFKPCLLQDFMIFAFQSAYLYLFWIVSCFLYSTHAMFYPAQG